MTPILRIIEILLAMVALIVLVYILSAVQMVAWIRTYNLHIKLTRRSNEKQV